MADPIEAHYDGFPYPQARSMTVPRSPTHTAGVLSYLLRRRAHDALPTRPAVWVAGCGTLQGATWGRVFPSGSVLATDVSRVTLDRASELASRVGANNVRFERHDLREAPPGDAFDLVVCTGVVHHLPEPVAGLRRIREALAPDGAASVMVYSQPHRAPFEPLRRASLALAEGNPSPYAVACRVLDAALHGRGEPLGRAALEALWANREADRSLVADVLLNPREVTYRVDELPGLLGAAGLRFVEWLHPGAWSLALYADDAALAARASRLGPLGEAAVIQQIAGLASPLLELLVERDDAPARAPYTRDEKLAMPMVVSPGARALDLAGGEREVAPFAVRDGAITGTARAGVGAPGRAWSLGAEALPLLEAFDGTRTVAEVQRAFADRVTEDGVVALVDALGPRDVGLLAPAWAR